MSEEFKEELKENFNRSLEARKTLYSERSAEWLGQEVAPSTEVKMAQVSARISEALASPKSLPVITIADAHLKDIDGRTISQLGYEGTLRFERCVIKSLSLGGDESSSTSIEFQDCQFKDVVDFSKADIHVSLKFNRCLFAKLFKLSQISIFKPLTFDGVIFSKEVSCKEARFHDKLIFTAECKDRVNFRKAHFLSESYFNQAWFGKGANFELTTFDLDTGFRESLFEESAKFRGAKFAERVYFDRSIFSEQLHLASCHFFGLAMFKQLLVRGELNLNNIHAQKSFGMLEAELYGPFNMVESHCDQHFSLRGARFHQNVDFTSSIFPTRLDLRDTRFDGAITWRDCISNLLQIDHELLIGAIRSENEGDAEQAKKDYNFLRNQFELAGDVNAAEWAYYHFRRQERLASRADRPHLKLFRFLNWLIFDLFCGYGTKPFRLVIVAIVCTFIFAGIYFIYQGGLVLSGIKELSFSQALYYSFSVFSTAGDDQIAPLLTSPMKFVVSVESGLGLFITTLFVGTCTRKIAQ